MPSAMPAEIAPEAEVPGVRVNATFALTVQITPEMYTRLAERAAAQGLTMEALVAQAIHGLVNDTETDSAAVLRSRKVILPTNQ